MSTQPTEQTKNYDDIAECRGYVPLSNIPTPEASITAGIMAPTLHHTRVINNTALHSALADRGFRRVKPLITGNNNLLLHTTQGQLLRITIASGGKEEPPRAEIPEILQPYRTLHDTQVQGAPVIEGLGDYIRCIEIVPECIAGGEVITEEEYKAFIEKINNKYPGSRPTFQKEDLGKLKMPDGSAGPIIILDRDAFDCPEKAVLERKDAIKTSDRYDSEYVVPVTGRQESRFAILKEQGSISVQELCYENLRPKGTNQPHHLSGVLNTTEIDALAAIASNFEVPETKAEAGAEFADFKEQRPSCLEGIAVDTVSAFLHLVKKEGWYPSQALAIMAHEREQSRASQTNAASVTVEGGGTVTNRIQTDGPDSPSK